MTRLQYSNGNGNTTYNIVVSVSTIPKQRELTHVLSLINLNNILRNKFYKIGLWALRSSLFHLMMTYAIRESLKRSDIQHL